VSALRCVDCGQPFTPAANLQDRYPGWQPKRCARCHARQAGGGARRTRAREQERTLAEVLETFDRGPDSGVFTDGAADPNPGPGGWGAVYVVDGTVVVQDHGHEAHTTNNRMELTALLRGADLVPDGTPATLYTDSRLCYDTLTKWAPGWERRGWRRKTGAIANLELVQALYEKLRARPELRLEWIKAHDGTRWNEYADALATAYRRERL
jgi:ribonuclease HI